MCARSHTHNKSLFQVCRHNYRTARAIRQSVQLCINRRVSTKMFVLVRVKVCVKVAGRRCKSLKPSDAGKHMQTLFIRASTKLPATLIIPGVDSSG
jgi:hypothetical protein